MAVTLLITGYYRHPKMMAANAASTGELAEVLWCRGLDYINEHGTDGFLPAGMPQMLCPTKTAQRIRGLVKAGLWHEVDGGWRIHDYDEWNRRSNEMAELKEKKRQAGRKGAAARWGSKVTRPDETAGLGMCNDDCHASCNGTCHGTSMAKRWPGPGPGPGPGLGSVPEEVEVELPASPDHFDNPDAADEQAEAGRTLRAVLADWPEVDPDELRRLA